MVKIQAKINQLKNLPSLVVSDEKGNLLDVPGYGMLARSANEFVIPESSSLIPLPYGSDLHMLPDRYAVGIDRWTGKVVTLKSYYGRKVFATSAFLSPAHTALYLSAYEKSSKAGKLPLFAYAAVGFEKDRFVSTAMRVDKDKRQDCENFDQDEIIKRGKGLFEKFRKNRLTNHLIENCAFTYLCPAARNWVMGRWEAPIPTSIGCNSECQGCISKQAEESGVPSTQDRLSFIPTVKEICEYTIPHLENAPDAIVSFGQGCEGEPLTQAALLEDSIKEMRRNTTKGTINLNTNGSIPSAVERLCKSGLDSIRVSLNSVQDSFYQNYFNPKSYSLREVIESVRTAKKYGKWVSLNYFIYPGFTDNTFEMRAMMKLLQEIPVDMIQMRNLNMDPELCWEGAGYGLQKGQPVGLINWMKEIRKARPAIRFGYFNPSIPSMGL
ncbi:MAG: radical SAM protein [bacterium]|nr:radical SAM protein [bacterium]